MSFSKKKDNNISSRQQSSSNAENVSSGGLALRPPSIATVIQRKPANNQVIQRQTPAEITRDYQVEDDVMEEWSPKLLGGIPIPFAPSRMLTRTEGDLLDKLTFERGLLGLNQFSNIKDDAFAVSSARYPAPENMPAHAPQAEGREQNAWVGNLGHQDAFRHAYWNAMLTRQFGEEWTEQFTTAHEAIPGNDAEREAMDLYNNEIGRNIATANPDATNEEIADLIQQAIDDGQLTVVDRGGDLAMSDDVALWNHGYGSGQALPGQIAVPDGAASTDSTP